MADTRQLMVEAGQLLDSPQFKHLVDGFEKTCGLRLNAHTTEAVPLTMPFDPPELCRSLQGGLHCPLYFDPRYHHGAKPEIRDTCAGLGHAVIPVITTDGRQLMTLVSDPCRLGPVDMERLTDLAFKLKIFPDLLAAQAEAVPLVPRDRLMFAAQILFSGMRELSSDQTQGARALSILTEKVAHADSDQLAPAILAATLEFTGADRGYLTLLDADGRRILEDHSLPDSEEAGIRVLRGFAEWVVHAGEAIEVADTAGSAWCRHLAAPAPAAEGALVGIPLTDGDRITGGLVVGGADAGKLLAWSSALSTLTAAGRDAFVLARRLVASGGGELVDRHTGAYNSRFLEELLEKEISRAGRHHHDLSLVFFRAENLDELVDKVGERAAEAVLEQMVALMRSRTRKVNSLARVSSTDFCLVVPEAGQDVAERIARELEAATETNDFLTPVNGGNARIRISLRTGTVSNPRTPDAALVGSTAALN